MRCVLKTSSANAAITLLSHSDAICSLSDDIINKRGLAQVKTKNKIKITNYLYWHKIMGDDAFHRYIREGLISRYVSENINARK